MLNSRDITMSMQVLLSALVMFQLFGGGRGVGVGLMLVEGAGDVEGVSSGHWETAMTFKEEGTWRKK